MPSDEPISSVQRQYWDNVHKRAVKDARRLLRIETTENVVIGILLTITALAIVWFLGDHEIAEHTLVVRIAFTAAVICLFPFAYCWYFVTAPAKMAAEATDKINKYEQTRAALDIRDPYLVGDVSDAVSWRIKVHNDGAAATNVHMQLCNIDPPPSSELWTADYPYCVVQVGHTLESNKCHINPGCDKSFELTKIWLAAPNGGFLTTLDRTKPGNQVRIEPNERWEKMEYAVTAENADALKFILRMHANPHGVEFEKVA